MTLDPKLIKFWKIRCMMSNDMDTELIFFTISFNLI